MSDEDKKDKGPGPLDERLMKSRQVIICEEIEQKMARRVITQLLAMAGDGDDPITVFINSQGGHVEAGDTIHDIVKYIKPRVRMIGTGWVASAGTHIYLAADKQDRLCLPNTRFLIHQPSGGVGGYASDIAIQAEQIEMMRARLARIIAEATGQPVDKVIQDIDRDHWMDPGEAIKYGILSRVVTSVAEIT